MYLVDYGLAQRYTSDGKHRSYDEDKRRAHDGTVEFTSRDAHKGVSECLQYFLSNVCMCSGTFIILGWIERFSCLNT